MPNLKVGGVTHYYDKIGVAIVDLTGTLGIGDKVKFVNGEEEFAQDIASMQIEHQQVKQAKKGQTIGLKVDKPVKEKTQVYKVS